MVRNIEQLIAQRLAELERQFGRGSSAAKTQLLEQLQGFLTDPPLPKEQLKELLGFVGTFRRTLADRVKEIEEQERTKEIIEDNIIVKREKLDDERHTRREADEAIYVAGREIFRASNHSLAYIQNLALSHDKRSIAFEAESIFLSQFSFDFLKPKPIGIYVVNIDGEHFQHISGDSSGSILKYDDMSLPGHTNFKTIWYEYEYHSPKWIDDRTILFVRDEYVEAQPLFQNIASIKTWSKESSDTYKAVLKEDNTVRELIPVTGEQDG